MPTPVSRCQTALPLARSRQMAWSVPACWSTELTKTRSFQMIGVAADGPGRSATHFTFSVFEKVAGKPFSVVEPLKNGPRHCDQFSARRKAGANRVPPPRVKLRTHIILPSFIV